MKYYPRIIRKEKSIIARLSLRGDIPSQVRSRAKSEISAFYRNGVDAILVENHYGNVNDCRWALSYLQTNYPKKYYGINLTDDMEYAFDLAEVFNCRFVLVDPSCGHDTKREEYLFRRRLKKCRDRSRSYVMCGIRADYTPKIPERTVEHDLKLVAKLCDSLAITGNPDTDFSTADIITSYRSTLEEFSIFSYAGITTENVAELLKVSQGVIVDGILKNGRDEAGEVNEEYIRDIVAMARS